MTAASTASPRRVARRTALRREMEELWPLLTYHYGFTPDEIARMPRVLRRAYERALPRILAQQQMSRIEAAAFPNMKKAAQQNTIRRLERRSRFREDAPITAKSDEEHMRGLVGIGVELVNAEGQLLTPDGEVADDA